jgi:hypothetical protein
MVCNVSGKIVQSDIFYHSLTSQFYINFLKLINAVIIKFEKIKFSLCLIVDK